MDSPSERFFCIFLIATCLLVACICTAAVEITLIYIERLCVVIRNRLSLLRRTNSYGKVTARELYVENGNRRTASEVWRPQQRGKPPHLIGPSRYSRGHETTGTKSCDSIKNGERRCSYDGGGTISDKQEYGKEESEDIGESRENKVDRNSSVYRPSCIQNEMWRENVSAPTQSNASSQNNGNHFIEDEDGDVIMEDVSHLERRQATVSKSENHNMQQATQIGRSKLTWGHDARQIYLFSCDSSLNVVGSGEESCCRKKVSEKNRNGEACQTTRTRNRCDANEVSPSDASSSSSTVWCKEMWKDSTPKEQAAASQKAASCLVMESKAGGSHEGEPSFSESKMPISPLNELERWQAPVQRRDVHPIKKEEAGDTDMECSTREACPNPGAAETNLQKESQDICHSPSVPVSLMVKTGKVVNASTKECNCNNADSSHIDVEQRHTSKDLCSNSKTSSKVCNDVNMKSCDHVGDLHLPETARSAIQDADIIQTLPDSSDITVQCALHEMAKMDSSRNICCPQYVPVTTNISKEMDGLTNIVNSHTVEPGGIEANERKVAGQKDCIKLALSRSESSQVSFSTGAAATMPNSGSKPSAARTQEAGVLRRKMPPLVRDPAVVVDLSDFLPVESYSPPPEPVHYPEHSRNDSELERRFRGNNGSRDKGKQGLTVVEPGPAVMTKPSAAAVRKWAVPKRLRAATVRTFDSKIVTAQEKVGELKDENLRKPIQTLQLPVVPGHLECDCDSEETFFHTSPNNAKRRNWIAEPEPVAVRKPEAAARGKRTVSRRPRAAGSRKRQSDVIEEPMIFDELNDMSPPKPPHTFDFGPSPDNVHRFLDQEKTFRNIGPVDAKKRAFIAEPEPLVFKEQQVASTGTNAISRSPRTTVPRKRRPDVEKDLSVVGALSSGYPLKPLQSAECPFDSGCDSSNFGSRVLNKRGWTGEPGTEMTRQIEDATNETPTISKRSRETMATESQVSMRPEIHHPENLTSKCGKEETLFYSDSVGEPMEESPTSVVQTLEFPVLLNTENVFSCSSQTELTFWEALKPAPWKQELTPEPMETLSYIETPFTYITEADKPEHAIEMMEWDPIEQPPIVGLPVGTYANQLNQDEDMETSPSYSHWSPAFQSVISGANVQMEEMCY